MADSKNKDNTGNNFVFALVILVIIVAISGSVLLRILKPEAEATFINSVMQMLGFIVTIIGLLYVKQSIDKRSDEQDKNISTIKTNTNGALSAKEAEIKEMRANMLRHGINPDNGEPFTRAQSLAMDGK